MDETTDRDPDELIVQLQPRYIDIDDLLEVRDEALFMDSDHVAARIEIERGNALQYSGYRPQFTYHELTEIGRMLLHAKHHRIEAGNDDRVDVIDDLAGGFIEVLGFDFGADADVELVDDLPTVEDIRGDDEQ